MCLISTLNPTGQSRMHEFEILYSVNVLLLMELIDHVGSIPFVLWIFLSGKGHPY